MGYLDIWPNGREPESLVEALQLRAASAALASAITFLPDGERALPPVSAVALEARARRVAATLQARGIAPRERVLLLLPSGVDYLCAFFGCLYAGVIAVPVFSPMPGRRALERLQRLAADASACAAVVDVEGASVLREQASQVPELLGLTTIVLDGSLQEPGAWCERRAAREDVAFLQYTSGSTGAPNGVIVTHDNLLHNLGLIHHGMGMGPDTVVVSWLPAFHDMGLIVGQLAPVLGGHPLVLMPPMAFLKKPARWLRAISRYRGTLSAAPNFAYELCVRGVKDDELAGLDLGSWRVAVNGAEPVRQSTLARFGRKFADSGFLATTFYPGYGLAEATVMVSGAVPGAGATVKVDEATVPPRPLVSSGVVQGDLRVVIVDPETGKERPPGMEGEIWVAGRSVAQGYFGKPELTERVFHARLAGERQRFLRTGDLGILRSGELFISGRIKDLLIVNGRNVHPQDVEQAAENALTGLRAGSAAAFAVETAEREQTVLLLEVGALSHEERAAMVASARVAVWTATQVSIDDVALVPPGSLCKTTSGKLQRRACADAWTRGALRILHRDSLDPTRGEPAGLPLASEGAELVEALRGLAAARLRVSPQDIDVDLPLARYGLDSLAAAALQYEVEATLGVSVPSVSLLAGRSLRELAAEAVRRAGPSDVGPLEPATGPSGDWPLAPIQEAMLFRRELDARQDADVIGRSVRLEGRLDVRALELAVDALVERHPLLRARFVKRSTGFTQRIVSVAANGSNLIVEDVREWPEVAVRARIESVLGDAFELERQPPFRLVLLELDERCYQLLFAVHHLVVDFRSIGVLARDLVELYRAREAGEPAQLPLLKGTYAAFAATERAFGASPESERQLEYWEERLKGARGELQLRRASHSGASDSPLHTRMPLAMLDGLRTLARHNDTTLFVTLVASFGLALRERSGQGSVLIGTPTFGRHEPHLLDVVGCFVNPVPLLLRFDARNDREYLRHVRDVVTGAIAHSRVPFARVVERLKPERLPGRSPLFQALLSFEQAGVATLSDDLLLSSPGLELRVGELRVASSPAPYPPPAAELSLQIAQGAGGLSLLWQYQPAAFDAHQVSPLIQEFFKAAERLIALGPSCEPSRELT